MWEKLFDFVVETLIAAFLPMVHIYFAITGDLFLNAAAQDAVGAEKVANYLLVPYQYVFSGREASWNEARGIYEFSPRFPMDRWFWPKMSCSLAALPASFLLGGALKLTSMLSEAARNRYERMKRSYHPSHVVSNAAFYASIGVFPHKEETPSFTCQGLKRKPGEENLMHETKMGLSAVGRALNEAGIPWWVDCGTLFGTYRYGGVIPWDCDVDIALLLPDFDNVLSALSTLDPTLYTVQDWSGRSHPKSYLKIVCHNSKMEEALIDCYFFDVLPETKEVKYLLSLEGHTFFPEWWHIRESRFTVPTSFSCVFPLRKANFDGVEVFVPYDTEKYLQLRYGENLAPAKIYNEESGSYEKDLSHPYWQRAYVK